MIVLLNIHAIRSGKKIFQDLNWTINKDEHWVITGPNGSGKTALLEILGGRQHVQNGSVNYDFVTGATWDEQFDEKRKFIQYIPAHSIQSLIPMTGDVYYQQRYYSIGDEISHVTVRDILAGDLHHFQSIDIPPTFDLEPLLNREIKQLSNGQLKKVLILQRLLHHLPGLLLLDYPFEGLDRQSRRDFCDFIDFIVATYPIQVVIADHGHELPRSITHRLTLNDLRIANQEKIKSARHVQSEKPKAHVRHRTGPADVVIGIRDLQIKYGNTVILDNFNWTVKRGDRWALTGANGSGKTTLFSIIFADHPLAYSQEVYVFGRRRGTGESIWDIKSRINYLGPELLSYLDTHDAMLSAREYIADGKKGDGQRLNELIQFFETSGFIDRPLRHLSSGQLQLTLLMKCFMNTRELLLLDEPFQFLDPGARDRVAVYLQQYLSDDTTLVLITHYDEDLATWTEKTMRV